MRQRTRQAIPPNVGSISGIKNNKLADPPLTPLVDPCVHYFLQSTISVAPEQILDTCPPEHRDALKCDLDSAWQAVATPKVDQSVRATAWENWTAFATQILGRDPYLRAESKPVKQQALLGFAARVRTGVYGNKKQIGGQSVDTQLRLVAQTLVLAGYDDPMRTYGAKELDLPFRHMLKSMKDRDPAPKPMLALPVETIPKRQLQWRSTHGSLLDDMTPPT
eukprot:scaffold22746_cov52-Attheya_sp.AAC.4